MRPDGKWRVRTSVVHEPARAESRPRLEPPRNLQETAKRLESRVESARGPLSEPA